MLVVFSAAHASPNIFWEAEDSGDLHEGPGGRSRPCKRYGSPMTSLGNEHLMVMHGYFYDHPRSNPTWLCDLWTYSILEKKWTRRRTQGTEQGPVPSYKQAVAAVGSLVFVFGGDDGGNSVQAKSHVWGAYHNILYVLDTTTWSWRRPAQNQKRSPVARQGASLTHVPAKGEVDGRNRKGARIVLFGGLSASQSNNVDGTTLFDLNDLHVLSLTTDPESGVFSTAWEKLNPAGTVSSSTSASDSGLPRLPHPRRSHAAVASTDKLYIVGGFSSNKNMKNMNDVWMYGFDDGQNGGRKGGGRWTVLHEQIGSSGGEENKDSAPATASPPSSSSALSGPVARGGLAAAIYPPPSVASEKATSSSASHVIFIHGGAHCKIGCQCLDDTWKFLVESRTWAKVSLAYEYRPVSRHFHSFATLDQSLYVFGGESYSPYAYWNDLWKLNLSYATAAAGSDVSFSARPLMPSKSSWTGYYQEKPGMKDNLMFRTRDDEQDGRCNEIGPSESTAQLSGPLLPGYPSFRVDGSSAGSLNLQHSGGGAFVDISSSSPLVPLLVLLVFVVVFVVGKKASWFEALMSKNGAKRRGSDLNEAVASRGRTRDKESPAPMHEHQLGKLLSPRRKPVAPGEPAFKIAVGK